MKCIPMDRFVLVLWALVATSALCQAQSVDDEIATAVLAAPAAMAADAMVVRFAADGSHAVLREGSNGLVCYDRSDEPGRGFAVQCTSVENLARAGQTHRVRMSASNAEEVRATLEAAEANKTREVPKFGSVWYSLNGEDQDSVTAHQAHITIAVPFATSETLNLPSGGSYTEAGSWIMEAGTSAAHLMVPGR